MRYPRLGCRGLRLHESWYVAPCIALRIMISVPRRFEKRFAACAVAARLREHEVGWETFDCPRRAVLGAICRQDQRLHVYQITFYPQHASFP